MTPESKFKADLKKYLQSRRIFYATCPVGPQGGEAGNPDIIVCYKGRFIGLECKTPVGQLRLAQKTRGALIGENGGIFARVRSIEKVEQILRDVDEGDSEDREKT